ncbi:MAG TPA: PAS domain S-box protein [Acidimicrobiia bacterium]|nr:PAS domain S-box protein [Acidimicrobiia bacterium]
MRAVFTKPRLAALGALLSVVALTAVLDDFARVAHRSNVESDTSARLDALARTMSDMIARETAAADTMAVFVELTGFQELALEATFPVFAEALIREGTAIRSVQLAPGGILEFVHPLDGNEAALGLDLFDDPDRRNNLLPAIESGNSVLQGPFELVQGGLALAVRHPVYEPDDSFWGFAAVILDWEAVTVATGFQAIPEELVAGVRLAGDDRTIAGDPTAFDGEPLLRTIAVGATDTEWTIGMRPAAGWPLMADTTWMIWLFGGVLALLSAFHVHAVWRRPELLELERAAALADLARSEATFQATFQHAGMGIVIGDVAGRVVSANPAFKRIVGVNGDVTGVPLLGFLAAEHHRMFEREMVRAYRRATVVDLDVRLADDRVVRWGRIRASIIPGDDRLFVGIVEDITDRLRADAALAESEDRFRRLFEHAPIAIQREDHSAAAAEVEALVARGIDVREWYEGDSRRLRSVLSRVMITDLNPAARRLQEARLGTGVGPGPLVRHYTEPARSGFIGTLEAISRGETTLEYEVVTVRADGHTTHLDMKWEVPVVDGTPDYGNVMLTLHDISELREAERKLQREVESKDRFLASVAHELRTPLTAVVGFAHEIQDESGIYGDEEKKEFQRLIAFHSAELSHLIEDLLVWARADIGEVQVRPAPIDLGEVVAQCIDSMPETDVAVDWVSDDVIAYADPSRVRQIVRNLVTNAIRYGGPDVRVEVVADGDWSVIEVSDDGPELPVDRREAIFDAYIRAETSRSMPGSIGLGLTVSRTLARLQNGDLVFVRELDRNIFRVALPTSVEAVASVSSPY